MTYQFKHITSESVPSALARAEKYRDLNQPELAESIARDILAVAPDNRRAMRELGLSITDQFSLFPERFHEAERVFREINDPYESPYLLGLANERLCRALLRTGTAAETLGHLIQRAMEFYAEAEQRRAPGNDEAILRWNSIVRLLERYPHLQPGRITAEHVDYGDSPPF